MRCPVPFFGSAIATRAQIPRLGIEYDWIEEGLQRKCLGSLSELLEILDYVERRVDERRRQFWETKVFESDFTGLLPTTRNSL